MLNPVFVALFALALLGLWLARTSSADAGPASGKDMTKARILAAIAFWLAVSGATPIHGKDMTMAKIPASPEGSAAATFAGGCFWCMEPPFEKLPGVHSVTSGFTGGKEQDPTYEDVSRGRTGHTEAIHVIYDPKRISYATLVEVFWRQINPTDGGGQFADRGKQYRPGIFYHNAEQKRLAEASRDALVRGARFKQPIAVEITAFEAFWPAEVYHQDYYKKAPDHYKQYRRGSGREGYIAEVWGKQEVDMVHMVPVNEGNDGVEAATMPGAAAHKAPAWKSFRKPPEPELKKRLSPLQFDVTQNSGTERAFTGETWDNKRDGIYVDIVSGEPLFSSRDKFESGTGWPSFTRPLVPENVVEKQDRAHGMVRTEVRSQHADSHLGHVFDDGPAPTGLRYCMNAASMRFIPKEKLAEEGYGEFAHLFAAGVEKK